MIEKLVLKDFQIHRDLEIQFDPHLTILTGPSDSGKSSVLRAIKWLFLNQPSGEEFIARFGKSLYARVHAIVDQKFIGRKRGSGNNLYRVGKEVYRAFGQGGVPQPVERIVNVSEVNFQSQFDAPFWFSKSPGEVSRELNSIINLGAIDASLAHAAKIVRSAKAAVDVSQDRLQAAKACRDSLVWANDLKDDVDAAEAISSDLQAAITSRIMARQGIESLERTVRHRIRLEEGLALGLIAIKVGHELLKKTRKANQLRGTIQKLDRTKKLSDQPIPDLTKLERLHSKIKFLKNKKQSLEQILLSLSQVEHQLCLAEGLLLDAIRDMKKATKGICPVCGAKLRKL